MREHCCTEHPTYKSTLPPVLRVPVLPICREGEMYFHFSQAPREGLFEGACVEFGTEERQGKLSAVAVSLLPEGSVVFEVTLEGRLRGFIERDLRSTRGDRREGLLRSAEAKVGGGQKEPEEGAEPVQPPEVLPFEPMDLPPHNGSMFMRGAEVEYSVVVERVGGRRRAGVIQLLKSARQVGVRAGEPQRVARGCCPDGWRWQASS